MWNLENNNWGWYNLEDNNSIESNSTKKELDTLFNSIKTSSENICFKNNIDYFNNNYNLIKNNKEDWYNIENNDINDSNSTKEQLDNLLFEIPKNIDFFKNNISIYREWKDVRPFKNYNNNVLFLSKEWLLVFWENIHINILDEFKKNLPTFLEDKWLWSITKVFLYREWKIIEAEKKWKDYFDKNWEIVKIFFWDIISENIENLEKNILDIDDIEKQIWSIRVNKLSAYKDWFLLNIDTLESEKKQINIFYSKTWELKLYNNGQEEDIWDLFDKDIKFYKNFRKTFSYFENNNIYDEPKNEAPWEQLDWLLRPEAVKALKDWKKYYIFNWLKYELYKDDKINLPQVCLDYPLDFYEKFNNSFYLENWEKQWVLNFEELFWWFFERRRILHFINYIKNNKNNINDYFTLEKINYTEWISYIEWEKTENFIKEILSYKVKPWDLIMISWKLEIDNKYHNHMIMVSKINQNWNIFIQENAWKPHEINLLEVLSRWPLRKLLYTIKASDLLKNWIIK